jgi:bis(5'-adenosyl)-triphosphatase
MPIGKFPQIEDADRIPRSAEEMNKEAAFFKKQMELLEDE